MERQELLESKLLEWGNILKEGLHKDEMNIFFDRSDEDGWLCYLVLCFVRKKLNKSAPNVIGYSERLIYSTEFSKVMALDEEKAKEGFYTFDVPVADGFPCVEHIKLAIDNHLNLKTVTKCERSNIDAIFGTDRGIGKLKDNYNLNSVHILLACLKAVGYDVLNHLKEVDGYLYNVDDGRLGYRVMYDLLSEGDCEYSTLTGGNLKPLAFGRESIVGKNKDYVRTRRNWAERLSIDSIHINKTFLDIERTGSFVFGLKESSKFRKFFIEKLIKQLGGDLNTYPSKGMFYYLGKANVDKEKEKLVQVYLNNSVDWKRHYGEKIVRRYTI